ncbi:leucine/isoleucine/valine transporter subunit; ATP-binding component of ABC superfamily [Klebsiella pneumoniae]|uniref:ABC transporter ATP-binding protein n=2 Tax=Klebsiella TaxID=570 RepID=A0A2J4ZWT4_9ENTR|nr:MULTISPECIES: ABC transporter ATP-binding protein [Klebsiella]EKW4788474.1 ABC transporter ATP-binding protein [Klebsiella variicola]NUD37406.1 ABC transporter ATP-binding protein [Escherichia coli]PLM67477.1 ABC transporter ATP-binding protein [Klebsiella michiganensis]HBV5298612.1 ABC transporter ATP-binding protein [Klebsiella oxytoca]HDS4903794.1 ABC transporter ATP-binding protein [Klebsiella pneumoniae subsp. pneumoniae]HEO1536496.1 ABC transporter ATP-binding protein [Klebsiella aer
MKSSEPCMLKIESLQVAYGNATALHGIDMEIQRGEIIALIGANGAGKSTTLRTISGLLKPKNGTIYWQGNAINGWSTERIVAAGIAHCPEERHVWPTMSVYENLMMGAYLCRSGKEVEERIGMAFHRFPRLRERHKQLAGTLSGGEQQMLAIARALMSEPELLLLDEPSLGLSPRMADEVFDVIRDINQHGVTALIVEQNVYNALSVASRAYVVETGRIATHAMAASLLEDKELLNAYLGG